MVSLRISPNNTYAQKRHDGGGGGGLSVEWTSQDGRMGTTLSLHMLSLSDPDVFTPPINTP